MSHARPQRRSSALVASLVALLLAASSFVGITTASATTASAATASAATGGYVGTGQNTATFDSLGPGTRTLPMMTAGVPYNGVVTGPQYRGRDVVFYCWKIVGGTLPVGLTIDPNESVCTPTATFTGIPEKGPFEFVIRITQLVNTYTWDLTFSGTVGIETTTTLTAPSLARYDDIPLSATVSAGPGGSSPEGSVQFHAGPWLIDTVTLVDGIATTTGAVPRSLGGDLASITAKYVGDADHAQSTSSPANVQLMMPSASGVVRWNDTLVPGALVELVDDGDLSVVVDTFTTLSDGAFVLGPGTITTTTEANKKYRIRVTYPGMATADYYALGFVTDAAHADKLSATTWADDIIVVLNTTPTWVDQTLAGAREGEAYADGVSAASPDTLTYSVSLGALPLGLVLDPATGAVTGTPTSSGDHTFSLAASNSVGSRSIDFELSVLPVGVAPTWTDDELPALQVGTAVDDAVTAAGDAAIAYAVSAGSLPPGLVLWPTTGAVAGIPTTAGAYGFTITATNDFGHVDAVFSGAVAVAPVLELTLDFAPGASVEDARTTISADGLRAGSDYTLTMFSTPRVLHTGTVGGSGGFSQVVAIPRDAPPGAHRLLLAGTAGNGTPMSATAWFTLGRNGKILAISYTGPTGGLAATGAEPLPGLLLSGMLLALGAGTLLVRRRHVGGAETPGGLQPAG